MDSLTAIFNQGLSSSGFGWGMLILSFLGGIIASLSPCTLGILPIIIGYVAGYGNKSGLKTAIQLFSFILGMSAVLTTLGLICAISGQILINKYAEIFALLVNGIILIMGLNLLGIMDIELPVFIKQMPQSNGHDLFLYPLLIGIFFALASTPCSTPILAGIMAFASLSANLTKAALMLFSFALGQGIIIILAGVFTSMLKGLRSISKVSAVLMKLSGALLVLASIFIYWKIFSEVV